MSKEYKHKQISAEIIADSKNEWGDRLTTFIITIPRIVLAEFNTHRMFSRNSASSRAIPFKTMVEKVKKDPFVPIAFQKDHKGMQGNEYFEGDEHDIAVHNWVAAAQMAASQAEILHHQGVTKQLCNRILEPYLMHTIIVTSTDWENFFALRAHEAAEIHIAKAAELMLEAYNDSTPKELKAGEWHIPFGDKFDDDRLVYDNGIATLLKVLGDETKRKIAVARAARVSYLNFEGKDDYTADIKLYERLKSMGHMSPFEHVAKAMTGEERLGDGYCGNFRGFIQDRKMCESENQTDSRVIKK